MNKIYKIKNVKKIDKNKSGMTGKLNPKRFMPGIDAPPELEINEPEVIEVIEEAEIIEVTELTEEIEPEPEDENVMFYNSLSVFTQDDIVLSEVVKNIKTPPVDIVRYAVLFVMIGTLCVTGYLLFDKLSQYVSSVREYDAIRDMFYSDHDNGVETDFLSRTRANAPIQDILSLQRQSGALMIEAEVGQGVSSVGRNRVSTQKLTAINSDFYCWIKVSNTRIDYPVVQTTNDTYYLNHSFERRSNSSGAIFVDHRNSRDIMRNHHTILYGHNMLDGSMFQPIISFGNRRDDFNNGIIELITEDAMYYYEIFSARDEDPRSGYIETWFATDEEWVEFLYTLQERSYFNKNLKFTADDRIVTLSTCINDVTRDWRFVVTGVLIDIK